MAENHKYKVPVRHEAMGAPKNLNERIACVASRSDVGLGRDEVAQADDGECGGVSGLEVRPVVPGTAEAHGVGGVYDHCPSCCGAWGQVLWQDARTYLRSPSPCSSLGNPMLGGYDRWAVYHRCFGIDEPSEDPALHPWSTERWD